MKSPSLVLALTAVVASALAAPTYAATHVMSLQRVDSMTAASPRSGAISFGSVKVFSVEGHSDAGLGYLPNLRWNSDQRVVQAIQQSGYAGSTILGYHMDGSSLTVYVKG